MIIKSITWWDNNTGMVINYAYTMILSGKIKLTILGCYNDDKGDNKKVSIDLKTLEYWVVNKKRY